MGVIDHVHDKLLCSVEGSEFLSDLNLLIMASDASDALAVREKFFHAARTGNLKTLKKLASQLDDGRGISRTVADIKDVNGRGALHIAAGQSRVKLCKYLLEELKLEVDPRDNNDDTPLIHAAQEERSIFTVSYLIQKGADPGIVGNLGSALHHSARLGDTRILKFLLKMGANVETPSDNGTPLVYAAYLCQADAMKILLDKKANPNVESSSGFTPVLISVASAVLPNLLFSTLLRGTSLSFNPIEDRAIPCLELLHKAGANFNVSRNGVNPLHIAASGGKLEIINFLLRAGSDPNAETDDGLKPIQVAAKGGYRESVEALLPVTSLIESIPNWTVDGIIEYMKGVRSNYRELSWI